MWQWLIDRWNADLDLQRLRALDDRLLADIGLDRDTLEPRVLGHSTRHGDRAPCGRPDVPCPQGTSSFRRAV